MIYEFRAWDEEFKQYSKIAMDIKIGDIKYATDYVWEMNTHIKDDYGIEIWQGDIIEIKCIVDKGKILEHLRTEVVFDEDCGSFGFQTDKDGEMYYMDSLPRKDKVNYWLHYDTCKVVGNIHEGVKNEKIS